jgi:carboxyl-terminal processing protease
MRPQLLLASLLSTTSLLAEPSSPPDPKEAAYPAMERFVNVLEAVRKRHPDVDKLTYDRLVNQALDGMLTSLDAHSSFIHPEMRQLVDDDSGTINNEAPSLGLSIGMDSHRLFISAIEKNGPAALQGITPDTTILSINGETTTGMPLKNALDALRRSPGEITKLTLNNPERPGKIEFSLTHRLVEEKSLIQANLLVKNPTTGYLRLAQFGPNCGREVEAALDELEDKGMKSLILDLRQNGGGDLHETVKIIGLFLPPATSVVSVRERDKEEEFLKTPDRQRRRREYPIAILIDRNSASASELTAGSLQDLKRATTIGETSYGKGSVQNIIPLDNNTALRLTIATYHTPSGNTPHLKGITPDQTIPFTDTDRENFQKSARPQSLTPEETKTLQSWQDPAIAAALKSLPQ